MLDCYLLPYFGPRKSESISRLSVEEFRADMQKGVPESVQLARDNKLRELQKDDPTAWLKPLDPGPRTINKCLGILTSIGFYVSGHNLATKNVAERIDKLPTEESAEDGEDSVIEENILTPGELVRAVDRDGGPVSRADCARCLLLPSPSRSAGPGVGRIDLERALQRSAERTIELPMPLIAELK
ncbi:hypothetical protein ACFPN2_28840 [Steroidobacter flavus]|uniref:Uncharacterized protein n=1 Tax=Steroidobacter flavus TaxID=1842136 RepID=A0ABV8T179_9GAMM